LIPQLFAHFLTKKQIRIVSSNQTCGKIVELNYDKLTFGETDDNKRFEN